MQKITRFIKTVSTKLGRDLLRRSFWVEVAARVMTMLIGTILRNVSWPIILWILVNVQYPSI